MKKVITVNGMSCGHCKAAVEKALGAVSGVEKAEVDLKKKAAVVTLTREVSDEALLNVVNEAGYEAISIAEKKGLW